MFEQNNKLSKGRKPGALNKVTVQQKEVINTILSDNSERFKASLEKLKPSEFCRVYLDLLQFVQPRLKAVEISDITPVNDFQPILIQLTSDRDK